jgi:hypothetical protein
MTEGKVVLGFDRFLLQLKQVSDTMNELLCLVGIQ